MRDLSIQQKSVARVQRDAKTIMNCCEEMLRAIELSGINSMDGYAVGMCVSLVNEYIEQLEVMNMTAVLSENDLQIIKFLNVIAKAFNDPDRIDVNYITNNYECLSKFTSTCGLFPLLSEVISNVISSIKDCGRDFWIKYAKSIQGVS